MRQLINKPSLWLHIFVLAVLFSFFGKYALHPNTYIFNQWGDGVKNYFTPAWYVQYDANNHFSGMLYPFGEHVLYTDDQPVISGILNFIDDHIVPIAQYTIGVINFLMLFSLWLCALLMYRILLHYQIKPWLAVFAALIISFMNPQMQRITGHYALSYCFYIPLLWYLHICFQKNNKNFLYAGLIIAAIIFFSFVHLYYLFIALLFFATLLVIRLLQKKYQKKEILGLVSFTVIPVCFVLLFLHFTDTVSDRPSTPYGFFNYKASLQSVLLPPDGWFTKMIYRNTHILPANYEGYAYIGFAGAVVCILSVFIYLKKSIRNRTIKSTVISTPADLHSYILAALLSLLFSMTVPFCFGLEDLFNALPLIKQFRSPGRFAWIFYFIFSVYTVVFLSQKLTLLLQHKKMIARVFIAAFLLIACYETYGVAADKRSFMKQNGQRNPFRLDNTYWTAAITAQGYKADDFQCILFVPFFLNGSEKLYVDRAQGDAGKAMEIAYQTGLPLIDGMLSRTSVAQTLQVAQLVSNALIKKTLREQFNEKPLLLITNDNMLTPAETYLISRSTFIAQQAHLKFFAMPVTAFDDTQNILKTYFNKTENGLRYDSLAHYFSPDSLPFYYQNNFDDRPEAETFSSSGSLYSTAGKVIIDTIAVHLADTTWLEVSFWAKTYLQTTAYPFVDVLLLDDTNTIIGKKGINPKFSTDVVRDWVRASDSIEVPPNCNYIRLETSEDKLINIDELLIRPASSDVFYNLAADGSFWFNNYPVEK